jgi:hypothetical protein
MLLQFVTESLDIVNYTFGGIADDTDVCGVSTKYIRTLAVNERTDDGFPDFIHGSPQDRAASDEDVMSLMHRAAAVKSLPLRATPRWEFNSAHGGDPVVSVTRGAIGRVIGGAMVVLDEFLPGCRRLEDDATIAVLYLTGPYAGTYSQYPHIRADRIATMKSQGKKAQAALTLECPDWDEKLASMLSSHSKHSIVFPVRHPPESQDTSQGASQGSVASVALLEAESAVQKLEEAKEMAKLASDRSAAQVKRPT